MNWLHIFIKTTNIVVNACSVIYKSDNIYIVTISTHGLVNLFVMNYLRNDRYGIYTITSSN